jgi:hypothetical protein
VKRVLLTLLTQIQNTVGRNYFQKGCGDLLLAITDLKFVWLDFTISSDQMGLGKVGKKKLLPLCAVRFVCPKEK